MVSPDKRESIEEEELTEEQKEALNQLSPLEKEMVLAFCLRYLKLTSYLGPTRYPIE